MLISTGNITNTELQRLFLPHLEMIATAFEAADLIEVTRFGVMLHG